MEASHHGHSTGVMGVIHGARLPFLGTSKLRVCHWQQGKDLSGLIQSLCCYSTGEIVIVHMSFVKFVWRRWICRRGFLFFPIFQSTVCMYVWRWWDDVWLCYWSIRHLVPFWKSIENSNRKSNESTPCTWGCTDGTVLSLVNLKISWRTWDAPSLGITMESLWITRPVSEFF